MEYFRRPRPHSMCVWVLVCRRRSICATTECHRDNVNGRAFRTQRRRRRRLWLCSHFFKRKNVCGFNCLVAEQNRRSISSSNKVCGPLWFRVSPAGVKSEVPTHLTAITYFERLHKVHAVALAYQIFKPRSSQINVYTSNRTPLRFFPSREQERHQHMDARDGVFVYFRNDWRCRRRRIGQNVSAIACSAPLFLIYLKTTANKTLAHKLAVVYTRRGKCH